MIAVDPTIAEALAAGAIVAYSLSGGKDSAAAALTTQRYLDGIGHPETDRIAIHADLGSIEWPKPRHSFDQLPTAFAFRSPSSHDRRAG